MTDHPDGLPDDELTRLRAEIERLRRENTALGVRVQQAWADIEGLQHNLEAVEAIRAEEVAEHEASARIATAMATAIGWETPGENWVEKAAHLRPHVELLAAGRPTREQMPDALRALCKVLDGFRDGCETFQGLITQAWDEHDSAALLASPRPDGDQEATGGE